MSVQFPEASLPFRALIIESIKYARKVGLQQSVQAATNGIEFAKSKILPSSRRRGLRYVYLQLMASATMPTVIAGGQPL